MRSTLLAIILLSAVAVLGGCRDFVVDETSSSGALSNRQFSISPGIRFEIAPGERALLDDSGIIVHFVDVTLDNRCLARCAFQGVATIRLDIETEGRRSSLRLEIPGQVGVPYEQAERVRHQGYNFRLLALSPHAVAVMPVDLGDYRSMLVID